MSVFNKKSKNKEQIINNNGGQSKIKSRFNGRGR